MLTDAHTHINTQEEIDVINRSGILSVVAGVNPDDCKRVSELCQLSEYIVPSFGLHPWYTDKHTVESMSDMLNKAAIIGEIGMDSVWCDVDLKKQEQAFRAQLDIAQKRKVPVILHTKGQEKQIVEILKSYDLVKVVHWYSCEYYLDEYIHQGCYFTVGPSVSWDKTVQNVVKMASLDKLLVETDGVNAVGWALNKEISADKIPDVLKESINYIAKVKGIPYNQAELVVYGNFKRAYNLQ